MRNYAGPCRRAAAQFVGVVPVNGQVVLVGGNVQNVPTLHVGSHGPAVKTFGPVRHVGLGLGVVPLAVTGHVLLKVGNGLLYFGFAPVANEKQRNRHQCGVLPIIFAGRWHECFQVFGIFHRGRKPERRHDFIFGLLLGGEHAVALVHQLYGAVIFQVGEQVDVHLGAAGQIGQGAERHGILAPFAGHFVAPQATDFKHRVRVNQVHLRNHEVALVAGDFVDVFAARVNQCVVVQKDFAERQGRIELEGALLRRPQDGRIFHDIAVGGLGHPLYGIAFEKDGILLDQNTLFGIACMAQGQVFLGGNDVVTQIGRVLCPAICLACKVRGIGQHQGA